MGFFGSHFISLHNPFPCQIFLAPHFQPPFLSPIFSPAPPFLTLSLQVAGTTDTPCQPMARPEATEGEIQFILGEINSYLQQKVTVRRGDVLAAWSGEYPRVFLGYTRGLQVVFYQASSLIHMHVTDVILSSFL